MMPKKRQLNSFNLAFLDIMFCGFGAVVLLVLIINARIVSDNKIKSEQLLVYISQLKADIDKSQQAQNSLSEQLSSNRRQQEKLKNTLTALAQQLVSLKNNKINNISQSGLLKQQIAELQQKIKQINKYNQQSQNTIKEEDKNKIRSYEGAGHRQYLTGLKLGGQRVMILLDSSASMLDETIVNIIVQRNLPDRRKQAAEKWQQAVNTVKWLVANLPENSRFMLTTFNKDSQLLAQNQWLNVSDRQIVDRLFKQLMTIVPAHGTNLYQAFSIIKNLPEKPDNIILITDGLPTLNNHQSLKTKVSAEERIHLFNQAIKLLPKNIPVNTLLLPLEGDPMAAYLFWKLAIDTNGSFMTPGRDWP